VSTPTTRAVCPAVLRRVIEADVLGQVRREPERASARPAVSAGLTEQG
jgi:hypothetical protein